MFLSPTQTINQLRTREYFDFVNSINDIENKKEYRHYTGLENHIEIDTSDYNYLLWTAEGNKELVQQYLIDSLENTTEEMRDEKTKLNNLETI
jgi:hypothetical protein